ncbi:MAG: VOC family protein [Bacteroidia bacterium]|nr:VOC family protein [Bacteroidia bacterium]
MIKFVHINIVTDDWKKLADFYMKVFNCKPLYPERDLCGDWLDRAASIHNAHITGIHLILPGYEENLPTLEIFQYDKNEENQKALANRKGFGHIAFKVDNVRDILNKILIHGGTQVGEIAETEIKDAGIIIFVYARDIDGNIIELQNWKNKKQIRK